MRSGRSSLTRGERRVTTSGDLSVMSSLEKLPESFVMGECGVLQPIGTITHGKCVMSSKPARFLKIPIEGKDLIQKIPNLSATDLLPATRGESLPILKPEALTRGAGLMTSSESACLDNDDDRSPNCCAIIILSSHVTKRFA